MWPGFDIITDPKRGSLKKEKIKWEGKLWMISHWRSSLSWLLLAKLVIIIIFGGWFLLGWLVAHRSRRPPSKRSPFGASVLRVERCRGCASALPTWTESSVMHMHGSNLTHSGPGSLKPSCIVVHIPLEHGSSDQNGIFQKIKVTKMAALEFRILVRGWIRKLSLQGNWLCRSVEICFLFFLRVCI